MADGAALGDGGACDPVAIGRWLGFDRAFPVTTPRAADHVRDPGATGAFPVRVAIPARSACRKMAEHCCSSQKARRAQASSGWSFDRLAVTRIEGTDGAEHPLLSPDGRWVAFFSGARCARSPRTAALRWNSPRRSRRAARAGRRMARSRVFAALAPDLCSECRQAGASLHRSLALVTRRSRGPIGGHRSFPTAGP